MRRKVLTVRWVAAVFLGTLLSLGCAQASASSGHHRRSYASRHRRYAGAHDARRFSARSAGPVHASQEPYGSGAYDPYRDYSGPGSIVLNRTEQVRSEPGVTLELAPDAKETATGGPVGGVPGFDGN